MNSYDKFRLESNQYDMFDDNSNMFISGSNSEKLDDVECWSVEWLELNGVDMDEVIYELIKKADK